MELTNKTPVSIEDIKNVYDNSTVHCAVVTDPANRILYASQSFVDALGYEPDEINGIQFQIFPSDKEEPVLENGINLFVEKPSQKGYVIQKNGAKALVDFESIPIQDGDSTPATLSRLSNLEGYVQYNRLATCSLLFENILNNLSNAVVVIDQHLIIEKANTTFSNIFLAGGLTTDKIALGELESSYWQNERVILPLKSNFLGQQYDFDMESEWHKDNGDIQSFKIVSRLIHSSADAYETRILFVITDITEEKENQTGRNQQIRHLMHELRNPLSNIALCVELLSDSTKENNQEDTDMFLAKASNSIQRMKQLINDLNDIKYPQTKSL